MKTKTFLSIGLSTISGSLIANTNITENQNNSHIRQGFDTITGFEVLTKKIKI